jgi:DNA invertase Pin-like site-specific DNA recombinase
MFENAGQTAREAFGQRLTFTKNYSGTLSVLVEKTDRLYRNPCDWVSIDNPDLEIHPVKDGQRAVN